MLAELDQWRIRAARGTGKARLSLQDIASASGVPRSSLASYLSGATLMPGDALHAVMLALGATAAQARQWVTEWEQGSTSTSGSVPISASASASASAPRRDPAPAGPVPRQLPPDVPAFTGREPYLAELDKLLDNDNDNDNNGSGSGSGAAVVISAIAGTAGVGKTALAVHWAHRVAERFPDGQLYVNLRGFDPGDPMPFEAALQQFLHALGAEIIPADPDVRAAMYRSALADRRMLVLLDNARTAEQVRPLLPGSASCLVLVTSRDGLSGLIARDGAQRLDLDRLSQAEALDLLGTLLGPERTAAEAQAVADLVNLCTGLPLTLRIAAERIARSPGARLSDFVSELEDEARRLDLLAASDDPLTDVRAVFSWSFRALSEPAARLFGLLGLIPGPDISVHGAANLADVPVATARRLLETLAAAHLLTPTGSGRYGMHDLLRVYAVELAASRESAQNRHAATTRLLDWYLAMSKIATDHINPNRRQLPGDPPEPVAPGPELPDDAAARAWVEAERANLVAAVELAADGDWPRHAWQLPSHLYSFFFDSGYIDDWIGINDRALVSARRTGDEYAQGELLHALGTASMILGRYDEALGHLTQALELRRSIDDRRGEAATLNSIGSLHHRMQRYDSALAALRAALEVNTQTGDRFAQTLNLANMALASGSLGRYRDAIERFGEVTVRLEELGNKAWLPQTMANVGRLRLRLGDYEGAFADLERGIAISEEIGLRRSLSYLLNALSCVYLAKGDFRAALDNASRSLDVAREIGDPDDEAHALSILGAAHLGLDEPGPALDHSRQALAVCLAQDSPRWFALVHNDLANALLVTGDVDGAVRHYRSAFELAVKGADRYEQGRAEFGLGRALSGAVGTSSTAGAATPPGREHLRRALDLFTDLEVPEAEQVRALLAQTGS